MILSSVFSLSLLLNAALVLGRRPVPDDVVPGKFILLRNKPALDKRSAATLVGERVQINSLEAVFVDHQQLLRSRFSSDYSIYPVEKISLDAIQYMAPQHLVLNTFPYADSAGRGVDVYVLDSGIQQHYDFGRPIEAVSFTENGMTIDKNGHGTHIAGLIGSKTYGVAKQANIISVRIIDASGFGDTMAFVKAFEYILNRAKQSKNKSIVNLSIGRRRSDLMVRIMQEAYAAGIYLVGSSGNRATDACWTSNGIPEVITVGAIDYTGKELEFSNFGTCVDVLAPGLEILSTSLNGKTRRDSGTSMASAITTGALALLLSQKDFGSVREGYDYFMKARLPLSNASQRDSPNYMTSTLF